MSYPMTALSGLSGGAARGGPSAEAVSAVAQRLAGIAGELEGLRLQLGRLNAMDWRSPAAAAFRDSLADRNLALSAVARDVTAAVASLGSYALSLPAVPPRPGDGPGMGVPSPGMQGFGMAWPWR
ncbi:hypothetical protein [Arthrobacter glacialis]|nr:hypothetical protein [Arthrobacter glacialis]